MYNNFDLQMKRVEEHQQDLQREVDRERMAAALRGKRGSAGKHMVGRIGTYLVALGTWLERVGQHDKQAAATYR